MSGGTFLGGIYRVERSVGNFPGGSIPRTLLNHLSLILKVSFYIVINKLDIYYEKYTFYNGIYHRSVLQNSDTKYTSLKIYSKYTQNIQHIY